MMNELCELAIQSGPGRARCEDEFNVESEGRKYNSMVSDGKISKAVNTICNRDRGGLYQPTDKCSKTNRPVIDIVHKKHPEPTVPHQIQPLISTRTLALKRLC